VAASLAATGVPNEAIEDEANLVDAIESEHLHARLTRRRLLLRFPAASGAVVVSVHLGRDWRGSVDILHEKTF
jgi:hypothetical protein